METMCVGGDAPSCVSSPDDELSEDDINQCEKEDPLHEDDHGPLPDPGKEEEKRTKTLVSSGR